MRRAGVMLAVCGTILPGCAGVGGLYGLGGGGGGGTDDTPLPAGLRALDPIDFANDVPRGEDPATAMLGDGSVEFRGGTAGTIGIPALYFDDAFAWALTADGTSTITFTNLDVRLVRLYFAHTGAVSAAMTAEDETGMVLATVQSVAADRLGDPDAFLEIDGEGASIARLAFTVPAGAGVAVDHLVLAVPEAIAP